MCTKVLIFTFSYCINLWGCYNLLFCEHLLCGMFINGCKLVGAGLAAISLAGVGVGIGTIFGCFILAVSRNPMLEEKLFTVAILGFALTEAIGLFGLMIVFLILFG